MSSKHAEPLLTIDHVRTAMQRPLPGLDAQITMAPQPRMMRAPAGSNPRQAGVLLLLYPLHNQLHMALTLRPSSLDHHSGQISLPGGGWEEGDANYQETALRETREEVGISLAAERPVLVLAGTDRVADELAAEPPDSEVVTVVQAADRSGVRSAIQKILFRR